MSKPKPHDADPGEAGQRKDDTVPEAQAEDDALNDARALQQMIEGTPDTSDEFRRIEQKR